MAYQTSDIKSASAVITAGPAKAVSLIGYTNGSDDVTLILYDNASAASGVVLHKAIILGADLMGGIVEVPVDAVNGIYLSLTGTGGTALVHFKDRDRV